MMRARLMVPVLALGVVLSAPAGAQTLADLKVELGQLAASFNGLRAELSTTGASANVGGGDALQRMDAIEAELMRLTARAEDIELRLNRVVNDGTNRIGDIEFRLCEETPGCDVMSLGQTSVLGGSASSSASGAKAPAASGSQTAAPVTAAPVTSAPALAVAEQADFDRAREVLGQGDFQGAAALFATYAQSYPGGPLIQEAHFLRGDALMKAGDTANAARAWIEAYSSDPKGKFAAESLLKLGEGLGALGQKSEACVTLAEVGNQYPGTIAATQAPIAMQGLGCN